MYDMQQLHTCFDTDSEMVGIDNRCSACISHDIKDFIGPLKESKRTIKGFGGIKHTSNIMEGTIKWKWEDDEGKVHKHVIPNSYYVPDGRVRLLSPQHWAKEQKGKLKRDTGETTNAYQSKLQWGDNGKYTLTVPMSYDTNVATFTLAPGYKNFDLYCKEAKIDCEREDANPTINRAVTDDEEGEAAVPAKPYIKYVWKQPSPATPLQRDFNLDGPQATQYRINEALPDMSRQASDMLKLHYKLGHIPFAKMRIMAQKGLIPSRYKTCEIPLCTACIYAKQTRRPWRQKPTKINTPTRTNLKPGDVVSVDQMVSPTPGFIAQITGILTTK